VSVGFSSFGDRNQGGTTLSAIVHTGHGVKPASCTMDNGSFHGRKRPVCGLYRPPFRATTLQKEKRWIFTPSLDFRTC